MAIFIIEALSIKPIWGVLGSDRASAFPKQSIEYQVIYYFREYRDI